MKQGVPSWLCPQTSTKKEPIEYYHSLAKEHPWAEHLTSLAMRGVGTLECFRIWPWKSAHVMFTIFGSSITVGKDINLRDVLFLFTEYVHCMNPYIYWMYQSLMFGGLILPFLFSCTYMFAQCMNVKFADYVDIDFFPSSFPFHSWAQDFYGERLASSVSAM